MIIYYDVVQQSPEWYELRAGKMTASIASKLVTPTGRPSTQYKTEMGRVIAERMLWQEPPADFDTFWMERGRDLEDEARKWFTVETGLTVEQVGFVESDDGITGFSPDGLVMEEIPQDIPVDEVLFDHIPVEIKVPKPSTHIMYLLANELPKEHKPQVHFAMAITGADHAWFMSYSQFCDPLIIRVERDDYTEMMVKAIDKYIVEFQEAFKTITGVTYADLQ
jgi:hypothetical protein